MNLLLRTSVIFTVIISDVSDQFEGIEPLPLLHISIVDDQSAWLYNWQIPVSGNKCRKQLLFGII